MLLANASRIHYLEDAPKEGWSRRGSKGTRLCNGFDLYIAKASRRPQSGGGPEVTAKTSTQVPVASPDLNYPQWYSSTSA